MHMLLNDKMKHVQIISFPEETNIVSKDLRNYDLNVEIGGRFLLTDGVTKKEAEVVNIQGSLVFFQIVN